MNAGYKGWFGRWNSRCIRCVCAVIPSFLGTSRYRRQHTRALCKLVARPREGWPCRHACRASLVTLQIRGQQCWHAWPLTSQWSCATRHPRQPWPQPQTCPRWAHHRWTCWRCRRCFAAGQACSAGRAARRCTGTLQRTRGREHGTRAEQGRAVIVSYVQSRSI